MCEALSTKGKTLEVSGGSMHSASKSGRGAVSSAGLPEAIQLPVGDFVLLSLESGVR